MVLSRRFKDRKEEEEEKERERWEEKEKGPKNQHFGADKDKDTDIWKVFFAESKHIFSFSFSLLLFFIFTDCESEADIVVQTNTFTATKWYKQISCAVAGASLKQGSGRFDVCVWVWERVCVWGQNGKVRTLFHPSSKKSLRVWTRFLGLRLGSALC